MNAPKVTKYQCSSAMLWRWDSDLASLSSCARLLTPCAQKKCVAVDGMRAFALRVQHQTAARQLQSGITTVLNLAG